MNLKNLRARWQLLCRAAKNLCWGGLWLAAALYAGGVGATSVLMLATTETGAELAAQNALQNEWTSTGASVTRLNVMGVPGGVTASTFTTGGPFDVVVISTYSSPSNVGNWTAINAAIAARTVPAFIMFVDGCCTSGASPANSLPLELAAIQAAAPSLGVTMGAASAATTINAKLNTASPYQAPFAAAGLNPLRGGVMQYFDNVPVANALYLQPGATVPPVGVTTTTYAMAVPSGQSYGGLGACIVAVNDQTPTFGASLAVNLGKIGPAFLNAVKPGGPLCSPSEISKAFSPSNVLSGGASTLLITVKNTTTTPNVAVTGLNVTDVLPAPVVLNGAPSSTCSGGTLSTSGGNTITLIGATLPAAGCTITVPVIWPAGDPGGLCAVPGGTVATNTIVPGPAASGGQFNSAAGEAAASAVAQIACPGMPDVSVLKTGPAQVGVNTTISYSLTLINSGSVVANNVMLTDTTPTGLVLQSIGAPCAGGLPCNVGSIAAHGGSLGPIVVTYTVPSGYAVAHGNSITNQASVSTVGEAQLANNSSAAVTAIGTGTVNVNNTVVGPAGGVAAVNGDFAYALACALDGSPTGSVTVTAGADATAPMAATAGAVCTVSQTSRPNPPAGYAWAAPTFSAFVPAGAVPLGGVQNVAATNTLLAGGLVITKTTSVAMPQAATFNFTVTCTHPTAAVTPLAAGGAAQSISVLAGATTGSITVSPIAAGSTCSVTELAPPAIPDVAWGIAPAAVSGIAIVSGANGAAGFLNPATVTRFSAIPLLSPMGLLALSALLSLAGYGSSVRRRSKGLDR